MSVGAMTGSDPGTVRRGSPSRGGCPRRCSCCSRSSSRRCVGAWLSHRWERAADRCSLDLTEEPEAFRRAHLELARRNLAELEPPRLAYVLLFSHPALPERLALGEAWRLAHPVESGGVAALDLAGKRAIVTGASSGIGRATAAALAAAGVRVAGGARRVERLETEVALPLDVADAASCERFVAEAVERLGGLEILVNNAGLALGRAPFDESSEEDEATVFAVNVEGLVRLTRLCLPHLAEWGHIVNMGSVAGRAAYEGGATYVTSKFAVRGFTYALREDLLGRPIRITTVDPGLVETDFSLVRFKGDAERAAAVYRGVEAMQPEDIADCVLFALTRPWHVNVDEIVVKARNQSSGGRILRDA